MVKDSITDGKRIAQLLASELTGLETGVLAAVEVVDAETSVTPDESGPVAYRLAAQDSVVGTVRVYPERVEIRLDTTPSETEGNMDGAVTVTTGADVKDAVDTVRATLGRD